MSKSLKRRGRKKKNPKHAFLKAQLLVAACGLAAGWLQAAPFDPLRNDSSRHPSAYFKAPQNEGNRLTWDDLACPGHEEYKRLAAIVHLEIPADVTDACAHPLHGKIAKVLSFAEKVKITMPPDWAPLLQADLGKPLEYFARMSRRTGIDLSQSTSIAYNKTNEKSVYLGGLFFQEDPLEALSVLIHEARHSDEHDMGHTTCRKGDIPKAGGGCDQELSIDPMKAGAYSYGAAFYAALGLYGEGLSQADRTYLLGLSLSTVSTRFNELPDELAQAFDLLAVLDDSGQVFLLHPFAREPIPLALPFLQPGETVKRIDFNVKNNGLLLFTSRDRLFTWGGHANGFERIYASTIPENMPIFDAARMRVPFDDYPFYNFLTAENQIYFYRFSTTLGAYELAPLPIFRKDSSRPEISRIFMGLVARSLFLGKDGLIYVGPRFGGELPFNPRADLQVNGRRWVYGTGGVVYEGMYAIADDGRVYYTKIDLLPPEEDSAYDTEVYTMKESALQATGGRMGRKFYEGLSLRALLDSEGDLQIDNYGREQHVFWRKVQGSKVVDFTILRRHLVGRALLPSEERAAFAAACNVRTALPDPWLGVGLGLNHNGELVVGVPGGQPCLVTGPRRYKDLKFRAFTGFRAGRGAGEHPAPWGNEAPAHTRSLLNVVEPNGEVKPLLPYDYK